MRWRGCPDVSQRAFMFIRKGEYQPGFPRELTFLSDFFIAFYYAGILCGEPSLLVVVKLNPGQQLI